ncbi:retrovirus-related pol polyprotein from transposon TNT 1-94 [Tanacetum coccineum]
MAAKVAQTLEYRGCQLNAAQLVKENLKDNGQDFQDSPDDEEDTRDNQEYLNNLEEEFQERSILAKSKRFFKKESQRFSRAKATDETKCHKCGRNGHFAKDCFSKTSVPSYSPSFQNNAQPRFFSSSKQKHKLRPTKDFEAKYNKVKAKLTLLSSSTSAPKSSMVKNKGLVVEAYEWDKEEVSSDDNEMVKLKVLMALDDDENTTVGKESARNIDDTKVFIPYAERPWLSKAEGFIFPNHDTGRILPAKYMNTMNMSQHLKNQGGSSSRSKTSRPLKPFLPCKHCGFSDHQYDDCVNYPECEIYGSYDHDTHGHDRVISLRRGIKPRNPQLVIKNCETYDGTVHTTTDHNDIE